jgi:hypothetical protein
MTDPTMRSYYVETGFTQIAAPPLFSHPEPTSSLLARKSKPLSNRLSCEG